MPAPNIKVDGIRGSIPQGYLLGRTSSGVGDVELISVADLFRGSTATAGVDTALPTIGNATVLANFTGASAPAQETAVASILGVGSALKWVTARTLSFTGDATGSMSVDGSAAASAALTLATVNSNVGSFGTGTSVGTFTVDAKGRITAASNTAITSAPKWTTARTLSFTGDATGSGSVDGSANVATALTVSQAAKWTTARTLSFTGDATGSMSVDGSAAASAALTLATVNANVGSFGDATHSAQITVDAKGRITAAASVAITGGGGGGSAPSIRGSGIQAASSGSYTVTWPTGTVAGDLVLVLGGHGFSFVDPAGWVVLVNLAGSNFNGAVYARTMTSTDISNGSFTLVTGGSFDGVVSVISFVGTPRDIRVLSSIRSGSSASAQELQSITSQLTTDMVVSFAANRANNAVTITGSGSQLRTQSITNASGTLYAGNPAASGATDATATFPSGNLGYFMVTVRLTG